MIGIGTLINCIAIVSGGVIGHFTGKLFRQEQQDAITKACGISVLFIAIAGALAIVGAIQDGILGDYSTLAVKAVLDFIIIAVMTSSLGKGCAFSAIPVLLFEGVITLLARLVSPIMTDTAIAYLSLIGSILIFCVGINLVWGKKIRVANMLPAVVLAVVAAYLKLG